MVTDCAHPVTAAATPAATATMNTSLRIAVEQPRRAELDDVFVFEGVLGNRLLVDEHRRGRFSGTQRQLPAAQAQLGVPWRHPLVALQADRHAGVGAAQQLLDGAANMTVQLYAPDPFGFCIGGGLPFVIGRLVRNFNAHPGQYADPEEGLRQCYFDSIVFQTDALRYMCDKFGAGRIMLGSDYPFPIGDPAPTRVVQDADIPETDKQRILGTTAARLFGIG